ncbi:MAG: YebC/PmpR family DNA-binding transcriptional regulator [Cellulosilyticaceae bacterium]
MSGHSKFANIKHKKARNDSQKGKIFTKMGREITVAVKEGGADPTTNRKLRDIIAKAKSSNMPNDTIQRNIKKAAGEDSSVHYEYITYEGYGPNGVAVIVETLTDNKNRTAANVRSAFSKGNGNMGTLGCVSFMFDKKGQIVIDREETDMDEDELMMLAIEAGADDFEAEEEGYSITTDPDAFAEVYAAIEAAGIPMVSAEVTMIPQTYATITSEADLKAWDKMIGLLEDDDDIQDIFHNYEEE